MDAAVVNELPEGTPDPVAQVPSPYPPPIPTARPAAVAASQPKSPVVALILSFLMPGFGQLYNGQVPKAFVFFFSFMGVIWMTVESGPPFALMIPFVYFYNLVDAWQSATRINQRALGGEIVTEDVDENSPAWGAALVALGLVFLLRNLGWINMEWLARWWPLLLVAAGAGMVVRSMKRGTPPPDVQD